jgi:hypothetical protein
MTPLRQRMIDAMVLRGFAARTQETYLLPFYGELSIRVAGCRPTLQHQRPVSAGLLTFTSRRSTVPPWPKL